VRLRLDRERSAFGGREGDRGGVVGVAGIGQDDRAPALGRGERDLRERRLRPRHDRHLAARVELDAVDVRVARGDRLLQLGQARERRVAVDVGPRRRLRERLDDVRGRADLRVAAPEVDERLALGGRGLGDAREELGEVLLGKPLDPPRNQPHALTLS
jgi:hypothetical protein